MRDLCVSLVRGVPGGCSVPAGSRSLLFSRGVGRSAEVDLGCSLGAEVVFGADGARCAVAGVIRVISGRYPTRGYPGNGGQGLSRSTSAERLCVRRRKPARKRLRYPL